MVPTPKASGLFTIKTSIGKCSETCLGPRRTFEPYLKPAGATTADEMEVEQLSQCSGCGWTSFNAQIAALGQQLTLT